MSQQSGERTNDGGTSAHAGESHVTSMFHPPTIPPDPWRGSGERTDEAGWTHIPRLGAAANVKYKVLLTKLQVWRSATHQATR
eukprot:1426373-Pleurochrysis_carterae.AAC.1